MTDERRTQWLAWKTATFGDGYMIWHEGLDVEAVTRLRGAARKIALEMLRLGLAHDDEHAAQALSAMRDHRSAPAMRALLARSHGSTRVRLALALHFLRRAPTLARHLIDVLRTPADDPVWSARLDAASGLRHFRGRADEAALFAAVGDPAYLVRHHACGSLLHRWGVQRPDLTRYPKILALVRSPAEDPPDATACAGYDRARELLLAIKARRDTPGALRPRLNSVTPPPQARRGGRGA